MDKKEDSKERGTGREVIKNLSERESDIDGKVSQRAFFKIQQKQALQGTVQQQL